jgi:hypothetical protein
MKFGRSCIVGLRPSRLCSPTWRSTRTHGHVGLLTTGLRAVIASVPVVEKRPVRIARALDDDGFELEPPPPTDGVSHRWRRGELIVDLLAPDGLRGDPPMLGGVRTIQIPGGSQALARTETVEVEINGAIAHVRRPTLLGAVLIKARSILVHADPDAQRADLVLLLSLIEDPSALTAQLKGRERKLAPRLRGAAWLGGSCSDGSVPPSKGATRATCPSPACWLIDALESANMPHAIPQHRQIERKLNRAFVAATFLMSGV